MTIRSATDSSMLCVVGNFDVTAQTAVFAFPAGGTWYDYLNGSTFTATGTAQNLTLQPGEFHIYLNRNLTNAVVTSTGGTDTPGNQLIASVFPNPATAASVLEIEVPQTGNVQAELFNAAGQKMEIVLAQMFTRGKHRIPLTDKINKLPAGIYLLSIQAANKKTQVKLAIQ